MEGQEQQYTLHKCLLEMYQRIIAHDVYYAHTLRAHLINGRTTPQRLYLRTYRIVMMTCHCPHATWPLI